jgi:hypothetical protein
MNKAELSKLLEQKVADKLQGGYEILNYAMDAASRDKLRRDLKVHGHQIPHEDCRQEEWRDYLWQVEHGLYRGEEPLRQAKVEIIQPGQPASAGESNSSSAGLWKARRH